VPLECDEDDEAFEVVTDEPEPDFADLAAAALDNANIDTGDRLCAARAAADAPAQNANHIIETEGPHMIEPGISFSIFLMPGSSLEPHLTSMSN